MNIVFTFRPSRTIQAELKESFPKVSFFFYKNMEEAESLEKADVLVTIGSDLTKSLIAASSSLKWIMTATAGLDGLPLQEIQEKDILLTNARGIHKIPMAEFTIGLMLSHVKQFTELYKSEQTEVWMKGMVLQELAGKHLTVLGTGAIGQEIARLAKAFRMTTAGVSKSGAELKEFDRVFQVDRLKEAVQEADFVVSVLPGTAETANLLQPEHFEAMKKNAVFFNLGRGNLVSEMTLLSAVNDEEIAHAYLDVFAEEPLPQAHPFWRHPHITVTPHISSVTKQYIPRAIEIFKHNLHCFLNGGEYQNVVDVEKGY